VPVLSLIVPVYNVEPYLAECLDSCINQTFKDLEIICVNDCSIDNSGKILEKYAKQDNRIKIINHGSNKGLGAARNTGIGFAQGDYCWFIDSDDYILLNACEILNDVITEFKTDIIRFNRIDYDYDISTGKKKILVQKSYSWEPNVIYTKKDHAKLGMPELSACMYITSTVLLKTMKFREGVVHEDHDFTPILFSKAESIYNVNYSFYCVRQRMGSITRNIDGMSEKRIVDNLLSIISLYNYIVSAKLSKKHFCTRTMVTLFLFIQYEYNMYSKEKTAMLNNEIKKTKKLIDPYFSCIRNNDIIANLFRNTVMFRATRKIYRLLLGKTILFN
jgi:glycosyltransferase involved in cell wall biosynthesis